MGQAGIVNPSDASVSTESFLPYLTSTLAASRVMELTNLAYLRLVQLQRSASELSYTMLSLGVAKTWLQLTNPDVSSHSRCLRLKNGFRERTAAASRACCKLDWVILTASFRHDSDQQMMAVSKTPQYMYNGKYIASNSDRHITARTCTAHRPLQEPYPTHDHLSKLRSLTCTNILQAAVLDLVVSSTAPAHPLC